MGLPKCRSKNRDKAFEIYKEHNGEITNRKIAELLGEKENTISNWKCRDKWNVVLQKNDCSTTKKRRGVLPKNKKVITEEVEQVTENSELTDKQQLFCCIYIRCFNATKAYQKAYGVNYNTAMAAGPRMLGNARIKKEIQKLKQARLNREMLEESDIFQKYMDIAFADMNDYVQFGRENIPVMGPYGPIEVKDKATGKKKMLTKEVNVVKFRESLEVDGTLISEVKQGKDGASIKLADRMRALDWLASHMDLATEEQKARIEQLKANTERIQRDSNIDEDEGVEIYNDAPQKPGEDIGNHHPEVSSDIQ
ncbi:hypothetical protein C818_04216 [Lachnospiraceae bacterium MD308]|nr:hypothetical protein C818_04216 [Lachnospiraceae bacterium MD308]